MLCRGGSLGQFQTAGCIQSLQLSAEPWAGGWEVRCTQAGQLGQFETSPQICSLTVGKSLDLGFKGDKMEVGIPLFQPFCKEEMQS